MTNIRKLINQLASQEKLLNETEFIAPCVQGGSVKTSVDNIIYTLKSKPEDFEGWGIFQPIDNRTAELIEEPSLPQLAEYLKLFKPLRLRLVYQLRGQTWLGYPINEADMQQRFQIVKPVPIHLVTEAVQFEVIIARFDGNNWWFDEVDRRSDLQIQEQLRDNLNQQVIPDNLHFSGMTPEMLTVYDLAWQQTETARQQREHRQRVKREKPSTKRRRQREQENYNYQQKYYSDQQRLNLALKQGGGELDNFSDRGEYWLVEWRTANGERHTSAIDKEELTVISSGICLSGKDRDFDLQSLVGVIEKQ